MGEDEIRDFDFTEAAWESLYDAVDDTVFLEQDAQLIYDSLKHKLKFISFGDYLKRYIYKKAELTEAYTEVPLKEYQSIIKSAFSDNYTPSAFVPTTAKLSALSKNWLTQQTVKRNVVFLLGFGLNMSVEDVNMFLTKALREPEINPKNPFEVICWYCYKNRYNYLKYEKLLEAYHKIAPNSLEMKLTYSEHTIGYRNSMYSIRDDVTLFSYLSQLKTVDNSSRISVTAKECFMQLYNEARDIIAGLYNDSEKRLYTREDITESDIEHIICAAIPTDRHGNLTPGKASKLNEQFAGKRFSRQRIGEILAGKAEINRFDLITLNFFIFSQKLEIYENTKQRYTEFWNSTNTILETCFMGKMYIQNPYECFVLMCILSVDPLGTYADVWELSYEK